MHTFNVRMFCSGTNYDFVKITNKDSLPVFDLSAAGHEVCVSLVPGRGESTAPSETQIKSVDQRFAVPILASGEMLFLLLAGPSVLSPGLSV